MASILLTSILYDPITAMLFIKQLSARDLCCFLRVVSQLDKNIRNLLFLRILGKEFFIKKPYNMLSSLEHIIDVPGKFIRLFDPNYRGEEQIVCGGDEEYKLINYLNELLFESRLPELCDVALMPGSLLYAAQTGVVVITAGLIPTIAAETLRSFLHLGQYVILDPDVIVNSFQDKEYACFYMIGITEYTKDEILTGFLGISGVEVFIYKLGAGNYYEDHAFIYTTSSKDQAGAQRDADSINEILLNSGANITYDDHHITVNLPFTGRMILMPYVFYGEMREYQIIRLRNSGAYRTGNDSLFRGFPENEIAKY